MDPAASAIVSAEQTSNRSSLLGPAPAAVAWHQLLPSWPTTIFLAALLKVGATPALLNDPDTYLHIGAGRWMLVHRALPFHDPFSHSLAGALWVPHEWLAEIALAGAFGLAGWSGVILITALGFAAAMALLTRFLLCHGDPFVALLLATSSLGLMAPHLLARPHILALALMVVWCGELIAARDDNRMPAFWLLPIMAVWANLHGGFMFGLALAAFLGVEALLWPATAESGRSNARHWFLFICAAILSGLVTPNGVAGLVQPFRLVTMSSLQTTTVIEWQAPRLSDLPMLEFWVLGALSAGLAFGLRLPLPRLLLVAGLLYLALGHARHADLLAIVAPLAVTASLAPQVATRLRAVPTSTLAQIFKRMAMPCAPRATVLAVALGALVCLPIALRPIERVKDPATPAAALAAAKAMGLSGPVFNEYGFGGYLIFKGVPTFIDGRMELYGNEFLERYLAAERGAQPALSELLDRYHISWTFLSPDAGAVMQLDQLPGWRRAYADDQAVIHVRDGAAR